MKFPLHPRKVNDFQQQIVSSQGKNGTNDTYDTKFISAFFCFFLFFPWRVVQVFFKKCSFFLWAFSRERMCNFSGEGEFFVCEVARNFSSEL